MDAHTLKSSQHQKPLALAQVSGNPNDIKNSRGQPLALQQISGNSTEIRNSRGQPLALAQISGNQTEIKNPRGQPLALAQFLETPLKLGIKHAGGPENMQVGLKTQKICQYFQPKASYACFTVAMQCNFFFFSKSETLWAQPCWFTLCR